MIKMIIVLKQNPEKEKIDELIEKLHKKGFSTNFSQGESHTIIGLIGDTAKISPDELSTIDIIESATRVSEPFKAANRKMHPENTVVNVNDISIGEGMFKVIAGPCSV